jgi:hypothetical protein
MGGADAILSSDRTFLLLPPPSPPPQDLPPLFVRSTALLLCQHPTKHAQRHVGPLFGLQRGAKSAVNRTVHTVSIGRIQKEDEAKADKAKRNAQEKL